MFYRKQQGHKQLIIRFLFCIFIYCNDYIVVASPKEKTNQKQSNISSNITINHLEEAAAQGNVDAQVDLGYKYYYGHGVPQDYGEALKWYKKAALQKDVNAQLMLGYMYQKGRGVKQDCKLALKWYMRAATQGDADAQLRIGIM